MRMWNREIAARKPTSRVACSNVRGVPKYRCLHAPVYWHMQTGSAPHSSAPCYTGAIPLLIGTGINAKVYRSAAHELQRLTVGIVPV